MNEAHPGRFHHGSLLVPVETFCDIFYCSMNVQSLLIFTVARPSKLIILLPSLQVQCMSKVSRRMINSETQLTQSSRPRATRSVPHSLIHQSFLASDRGFEFHSYRANKICRSFCLMMLVSHFAIRRRNSIINTCSCIWLQL